jgi:hypothetical protein
MHTSFLAMVDMMARKGHAEIDDESVEQAVKKDGFETAHNDHQRCLL